MTTTTVHPVLDVADRRKASRQERHALQFNAEAFDAMLAIAGLDVLAPEFHLIVRFTDADDRAESGYTRRLDEHTYLVKVRVPEEGRLPGPPPLRVEQYPAP